MKKIISFLLASAVSTVFAQGNVSTQSLKQTGNGQKGLYVGAAYMNISDMKLKYTARDKASGISFSDESTGGTHLGLGGVSLGFNQTPDVGIW